jgi:hypothetical protein
LVFAVSQRASAQLVINEFAASNDVSFPGPEGDFPDWIEIYNAGDADVMLGGYFLADDLADPDAMYQIPDTYPDSVTIPAGGYILFYANKGEATSVLNLNFKLSGGGEQIGFWNPSSEFLDSLTYGDQIADTTYGRVPDGGANWVFYSGITPGVSNSEGVVWGGYLMINEFLASNDFSFPGPEGDFPDWIEIYNAGSEAVDMSGYFMADDLLDPSAMYEIPGTFPDSVTVEAGGHILFFANKGEATSVLNLNFKLSGGGEQIGLWAPDQNVIDTLTYGEQQADTSYGRVADGAADWVFFSTSTPNEPNQGGIVVSVISYSNVNFTPLSVYPNPTTGTEVNFNKTVNIQVYNLAGQRLFTDNNVSRLDVTRFNSGLYLVKTDEGELVKLIVK